jgi:hypothetical protein
MMLTGSVANTHSLWFICLNYSVDSNFVINIEQTIAEGRPQRRHNAQMRRKLYFNGLVASFFSILSIVPVQQDFSSSAVVL